ALGCPVLPRATLFRSARGEEMVALVGRLDGALNRIGQDRVDPTGLLAARLAEAQSMGQALLAAYADDRRAMPDWEQVAGKMAGFESAVRATAGHEAIGEQATDGSAGGPEAGGAGELPVGVVDREQQERFDTDLAEVFLPEAEELLDASDAAVYNWSRDHDDHQPLAELLRHLHTLKGGARMAGVTPLADLTHELESVLTRVSDG